MADGDGVGEQGEGGGGGADLQVVKNCGVVLEGCGEGRHGFHGGERRRERQWVVGANGLLLIILHLLEDPEDARPALRFQQLHTVGPRALGPTHHRAGHVAG